MLHYLVSGLDIGDGVDPGLAELVPAGRHQPRPQLLQPLAEPGGQHHVHQEVDGAVKHQQKLRCKATLIQLGDILWMVRIPISFRTK